jgi:hypothetical protein
MNSPCPNEPSHISAVTCFEIAILLLFLMDFIFSSSDPSGLSGMSFSLRFLWHEDYSTDNSCCV